MYNLPTPSSLPPPVSHILLTNCLMKAKAHAHDQLLPPTSPLSNGEQHSHTHTHTHSLAHSHRVVSPPSSLINNKNGNNPAKNPKMSLENIMLPFDQHVECESLTPRPIPVPVPCVKHDKVLQLVPVRSRHSTSPIHHSENLTNGFTGGGALSVPDYSFIHISTSNTLYSSKASTLGLTGSLSNAGGGGGGGGVAVGVQARYCGEPKAKRPWTESEDLVLRDLVQKLGTGAWAAMAQQIPGRTGKQVRERWLNHLSPSVTKRPWSIEEDNVIIENHKRIGNCWSRIAKLLQGRSDNSVKNRYYTTLRRRIASTSSSTDSDRKRKRTHSGGVSTDPTLGDGSSCKRARVWD